MADLRFDEEDERYGAFCVFDASVLLILHFGSFAHILFFAFKKISFCMVLLHIY